MDSTGSADPLGLDLQPIDGQPQTIPATLLAHAAKYPNKTFIEVWSPERGPVQSVSYSSLADSMIAAALWLRDGIGLGRGEYCAMLAPNSIAYLSFSLGSMCLGAISVRPNAADRPEPASRLTSPSDPRADPLDR